MTNPPVVLSHELTTQLRLEHAAYLNVLNAIAIAAGVPLADLRKDVVEAERRSTTAAYQYGELLADRVLAKAKADARLGWRPVTRDQPEDGARGVLLAHWDGTVMGTLSGRQGANWWINGSYYDGATLPSFWIVLPDVPELVGEPG